MTTVATWIAALDAHFPPSWAEEWDSVGLQVGDRAWRAERVLVALDPTIEVVTEAHNLGCGLLVTHHPLLFRPLARLDLADPVAAAVTHAVTSGVAVVACHTNADVVEPGVSDALAAALDVEVTGVLRPTAAGQRVKLVTFVPVEATAKVLDAISGAGAGAIGEYSHCSFRVRGTGTFLPSERANPAVGERGELTEVEEDRLEVVVPRERLATVIEAMLDAHPYEEVAYDVIQLSGGGGRGLGRTGRLPAPMRARDLARLCEERLGAPARLAGDPDREVQTVALCGGAGSSLIPDAIRSGVDAFVTGDLKHHQTLDAAAAGLTVIDAGHHGTEQPFVPLLATLLRDEGLGEVLEAQTHTDPFLRP